MMSQDFDLFADDDNNSSSNEVRDSDEVVICIHWRVPYVTLVPEFKQREAFSFDERFERSNSVGRMLEIPFDERTRTLQDVTFSADEDSNWLMTTCTVKCDPQYTESPLILPHAMVTALVRLHTRLFTFLRKYEDVRRFNVEFLRRTQITGRASTNRMKENHNRANRILRKLQKSMHAIFHTKRHLSSLKQERQKLLEDRGTYLTGTSSDLLEEMIVENQNQIDTYRENLVLLEEKKNKIQAIAQASILFNTLDNAVTFMGNEGVLREFLSPSVFIDNQDLQNQFVQPQSNQNGTMFTGKLSRAFRVLGIFEEFFSTTHLMSVDAMQLLFTPLSWDPARFSNDLASAAQSVLESSEDDLINVDPIATLRNFGNDFKSKTMHFACCGKVVRSPKTDTLNEMLPYVQQDLSMLALGASAFVSIRINQRFSRRCFLTLRENNSWFESMMISMTDCMLGYFLSGKDSPLLNAYKNAATEISSVLDFTEKDWTRKSIQPFKVFFTSEILNGQEHLIVNFVCKRFFDLDRQYEQEYETRILSYLNNARAVVPDVLREFSATPLAMNAPMTAVSRPGSAYDELFEFELIHYKNPNTNNFTKTVIDVLDLLYSLIEKEGQGKRVLFRTEMIFYEDYNAALKDRNIVYYFSYTSQTENEKNRSLSVKRLYDRQPSLGTILR